MNIIAATLTIKDDIRIEDIPEVLKQEKEVIEAYKQAGYLHDLYLRPAKNGAMLLFKELDQDRVTELVNALPLFPYLKPVDYLALLK